MVMDWVRGDDDSGSSSMSGIMSSNYLDVFMYIIGEIEIIVSVLDFVVDVLKE